MVRYDGTTSALAATGIGIRSKEHDRSPFSHSDTLSETSVTSSFPIRRVGRSMRRRSDVILPHVIQNRYQILGGLRKPAEI